MPTTLKSVLENVVVTLNDLKCTSYTIQSLVRWVNDGQREIHVKRRDLFNIEIEHPLVPGVRQSLPATGSALIEISSNATGTFGPVTRTKRTLIDAQVPGWRGLPGSLEIDHFMYDERQQKVFEVYPPAIAGSKVLLEFASVPADLAIPPAGATVANLSNSLNVAVGDLQSTALQHYLCHRAFLVGRETVEVNRSNHFYTLFADSLVVEGATLAGMSPQNTN